MPEKDKGFFVRQNLRHLGNARGRGRPWGPCSAQAGRTVRPQRGVPHHELLDGVLSLLQARLQAAYQLQVLRPGWPLSRLLSGIFQSVPSQRAVSSTENSSSTMSQETSRPHGNAVVCLAWPAQAQATIIQDPDSRSDLPVPSKTTAPLCTYILTQPALTASPPAPPMTVTPPAASRRVRHFTWEFMCALLHVREAEWLGGFSDVMDSGT